MEKRFTLYFCVPGNIHTENSYVSDCRRATGEKDIEGTALQDQFCPDITDRCTRVGYQPYRK